MKLAQCKLKSRRLQEQVASLQEILAQTRQALEGPAREHHFAPEARRPGATVLWKKERAVERRPRWRCSSTVWSGAWSRKKRRSRPRGRAAPCFFLFPTYSHPDDLEVVRQVIEPDLVQAEPDQWKKIGEEISRRLDYQPASSSGRNRPAKYVRADRRPLPPVLAPAPAQVADHSLAAPGLLAQF